VLDGTSTRARHAGRCASCTLGVPRLPGSRCHQAVLHGLIEGRGKFRKRPASDPVASSYIVRLISVVT